MPLEILVVMVVGGIGAIALALHLLGKSEPVALTEDSARVAWLRQFPEDQPQVVTVARDGHAALVETPGGRGLVWSFGADTVARKLVGAAVQDTATGLRVSFGDYAAPDLRIALEPDERRHWTFAAQP